MTNNISLNELKVKVQEECNTLITELQEGKHPEVFQGIQKELDWKFPAPQVLKDLMKDRVLDFLEYSYGTRATVSILKMVDITYLTSTPKFHRKASVYLDNVSVTVQFSLSNSHLSYISLDEDWVLDSNVSESNVLSQQIEATQNRVYYELAVEELESKLKAVKEELAKAVEVTDYVGEVPQEFYRTNANGVDLISLLSTL